MQPYFLPYVGYWQLLNYVDKWVFFDDIQFEKKGWVCRNRICHPNDTQNFQYLIIPVKKSYLKKISEIEIDISLDDLMKNYLGKLSSFKRKAAGYEVAVNLIKNIFEYKYPEKPLLSEILLRSIVEVNKLLNINTEIILQKNIVYDKKLINEPGDWAFEISRALNVREYVNPIKGAFLFNQEKFNKNDIKISFLNPTINSYPNHQKMLPKLSILDLLLWNDIDWVKQQIRLNRLG